MEGLRLRARSTLAFHVVVAGVRGVGRLVDAGSGTVIERNGRSGRQWEGACEGRHCVLCRFGGVCGALCVTWGVTAQPKIQRWGPGTWKGILGIRWVTSRPFLCPLTEQR